MHRDPDKYRAFYRVNYSSIPLAWGLAPSPGADWRGFGLPFSTPFSGTLSSWQGISGHFVRMKASLISEGFTQMKGFLRSFGRYSVVAGTRVDPFESNWLYLLVGNTTLVIIFT